MWVLGVELGIHPASSPTMLRDMGLPRKLQARLLWVWAVGCRLGQQYPCYVKGWGFELWIQPARSLVGYGVQVSRFCHGCWQKKCCVFELWLQPVTSPVCYWIRVLGWGRWRVSMDAASENAVGLSSGCSQKGLWLCYWIRVSWDMGVAMSCGLASKSSGKFRIQVCQPQLWLLPSRIQ